MKQFLTTCVSEAIVADKTPQEMDQLKGGLGLKFDFPGDPRVLKDKSKMKLWKKYFSRKFIMLVVKPLLIPFSFRIWKKSHHLKDTSIL